MRKLITALMVIIFILAGCSDTTGPKSKDEKNGNTLLASHTIGTGGGNLETEDVSVIVPPGAFSSDTELEIYTSEDNSFSDNTVSGTSLKASLPAITNHSRYALNMRGNFRERIS